VRVSARLTWVTAHREHVFVDESKKGRLLLVAAGIQANNLRAARKAMDGLRLRNQRRVHYKDENATRKKEILDVIGSTGATATVYAGPEGVRELAARRVCLERLVMDLAERSARRLVVELDTSLVEHDRRWLYAASRRSGAAFEYHHLRAHEECLLWIPDAIAWCWAARGHWRDRVRSVVATEIVDL
jgi:hypothetical protein